MAWVEQRNRTATDVEQLDEFHIGRQRVIMNFVDDNRPNARAGVACAQCERILHREKFLANAVDVASKANAIEHPSEDEAVAVTGELRVGQRRENIDRLAGGT